MPDGSTGGVTFTLDGAHLRVDARPARLVSMLKHDDGAPVVTAQPTDGDAKVDTLPAAARQATFQVRDDVTVEATSAAAFVAVAEDTGRCLVISYGGEVTVVPGGDDRFALAPNEALVIGGPGSAPAVVPVADLSAASHPEVAALLDATTDALFAPEAASPEEREVEVAPASDESKPTSGAARPAAAAAAGAAAGGAAKKSAATPAKAAGANKAGTTGSGRRKKGKKGRPQPQKAGATKKAAAAAGAGALAGAAAGNAAAATTAKKAPTKAAGGGGKQPPKAPPTGGGGGGGGGHDDEPYEDTPRDRRFLVGAVLVALLLAVGAVLLLSNVSDDTTEVASGEDTSTTEQDDEEVADTTTSSTIESTTTTAAPTTTTTAPATTTTARTTTTSTPAQPKYAIEPKSCVQNGNTITYTASIKNDAATPYDFTIDVSFKSSSDGSEVAKATANVTRLAAGRTAEFTATATSSRNLAGVGACDVSRVDARPSA